MFYFFFIFHLFSTNSFSLIRYFVCLCSTSLWSSLFFLSFILTVPFFHSFSQFASSFSFVGVLVFLRDRVYSLTLFFFSLLRLNFLFLFFCISPLFLCFFHLYFTIFRCTGSAMVSEQRIILRNGRTEIELIQ